MARSRHGMYGGIDFRNLPTVSNYHEALVTAEAARPLRGSEWRPLRGIRTSRNPTKVRIADNGDVVFRLYQTDVVTWHLDGTFTVEGHPTLHTGQYANRLTPSGVYLSARSEMLMLGDYWKPVPVKPGDRGYDPSWGERPWQTGEQRRYTRNPDQLATRCKRGDRIHVIRSRKHPTGWMFDPETVQPVEYQALDRAKARALSAEYHLADFVSWVRAVEKLDTTEREPRWKSTKSTSGRCAEMLDLLKEQRFADAYELLPRKTGWINGCYKDVGASLDPLRWVRAYLYVIHGATHAEVSYVMPAGEYVRKIKTNIYERI